MFFIQSILLMPGFYMTCFTDFLLTERKKSPLKSYSFGWSKMTGVPLDK